MHHRLWSGFPPRHDDHDTAILSSMSYMIDGVHRWENGAHHAQSYPLQNPDFGVHLQYKCGQPCRPFGRHHKLSTSLQPTPCTYLHRSLFHKHGHFPVNKHTGFFTRPVLLVIVAIRRPTLKPLAFLIFVIRIDDTEYPHPDFRLIKVYHEPPRAIERGIVLIDRNVQKRVSRGEGVCHDVRG